MISSSPSHSQQHIGSLIFWEKKFKMASCSTVAARVPHGIDYWWKQMFWNDHTKGELIITDN